jgi:hypothetical protein
LRSGRCKLKAKRQRPVATRRELACAAGLPCGGDKLIAEGVKPATRDALLTALAKARGWIDNLRLGRRGSFAEIAEREVQGERHIRLLVPLAFLSPRIVAAIVDGTAPTDLTVTGLARALPYSWGERERSIGLSL